MAAFNLHPQIPARAESFSVNLKRRLAIRSVAKSLLVVYYCCATIVLAWFLGSVLRGEQSAWIVAELHTQNRLFGPDRTNQLVTIGLYTLFYSALALVPYAVLGLPFLKTGKTPAATLPRQVRWCTSLWVAVSVLLFVRPLSAFVRALPSGTLYEWLFLLWLIGTAGVSFSWWWTRP